MFFFQYHQQSDESKAFQNPSFSKIMEFENVKFPKGISSKDGVWIEFLEIDINSTFSKKNKK